MDLALKRLRDALDQLETAATQHGRDGAERRRLAEALAVAEGERDATAARATALEGAATEVAGRLGAAGASLRRLLAAAEEDNA